MHQIIQLCGENDIEFDTVDSLQPVIDSSNCCVIPDKLYADFEKVDKTSVLQPSVWTLNFAN